LKHDRGKRRVDGPLYVNEAFREMLRDQQE